MGGVAGNDFKTPWNKLQEKFTTHTTSEDGGRANITSRRCSCQSSGSHGSWPAELDWASPRLAGLVLAVS